MNIKIKILKEGLKMGVAICFNGGMPKMDSLVNRLLARFKKGSYQVEKIDFTVGNKIKDVVLDENGKRVFVGYSAGALNLLLSASNAVKKFDLIILIAPAGIENPPTIKHLFRFGREISRIRSWRIKFSIVGELILDSVMSPLASLLGLKKILQANIIATIQRQIKLGAKIYYLKERDDKLFNYSLLEKTAGVSTIKMTGGHFGIIEHRGEFSQKIKKIIEEG